jgi:hypothetical protein
MHRCVYHSSEKLQFALAGSGLVLFWRYKFNKVPAPIEAVTVIHIDLHLPAWILD